MMGQKIKTLASGNIAPGYHSVIWNGTNDAGAKGRNWNVFLFNKYKSISIYQENAFP